MGEVGNVIRTRTAGEVASMIPARLCCPMPGGAAVDGAGQAARP
jgi:hypothetical protein